MGWATHRREHGYAVAGPEQDGSPPPPHRLTNPHRHPTPDRDPAGLTVHTEREHADRANVKTSPGWPSVPSARVFETRSTDRVRAGLPVREGDPIAGADEDIWVEDGRPRQHSALDRRQEGPFAGTEARLTYDGDLLRDDLPRFLLAEVVDL